VEVAAGTAAAAAAAQNLKFHAGVHSGYGLPGHQPWSPQEGEATDAAVVTDEVKHGYLAVAADVVTPCSVVRGKLLAPAVGQGLGLVYQNDAEACENCAAAAAAADVVVVVAVAVAVAAAAADDEDMVEVGGLRLRPHQERCRRDHQQQYHQYLTQLECNKNVYIKDDNIIPQL
jgi:hypothetical protein